MAFSLTFLLEQFPTTTSYFVCTRSYVWFADTYERTRQYSLRSLDVLNGRNTALELYVDVHDVAFADRCNMCTRYIAFLIVVLINYSNNPILREVEDIRLTTYEEC